MKLTYVIAKIFRVITVPPVLALALLLYLYFGATGFFSDIYQLAVVCLCIVVVPLLAYPVCYAVPKLRALGRDAERKMAFVTTATGYLLLVIPAVLGGFSRDLKIVSFTYVLSVIMLILFNHILKIKASGHACGVFGPMLMFVYAGGLVMVLPCALLLLAMSWSSLKLRRHTPRELVLGALCSTVSLAIVLALFNLV